MGAADGYGNVLILWNDDSPGRQHVLAVLAAAGPDSRRPAGRIHPRALEATGRSRSLPPSSFTGVGVGPDLTATFAYEWDFGDGGGHRRARQLTSSPFPASTPWSSPSSTPRAGAARRRGSITVRAPAESASDTDLVLPVVTDSRGVGTTHYTTELTLVSRASRPVTALLQYTAAVGSGSGYASLTLAPGEERVIPDAVAFLRSRGLPIPDDGSSQIGTLRVVFRARRRARSFWAAAPRRRAAEGTYGLFYPSAATNESTPGRDRTSGERCAALEPRAREHGRFRGDAPRPAPRSEWRGPRSPAGPDPRPPRMDAVQSASQGARERRPGGRDPRVREPPRSRHTESSSTTSRRTAPSSRLSRPGLAAPTG